MSNHDPPPPLSFMSPSYYSGNVGNFWPQNLMNNEGSELQSQIEHAPPFKRPRNYDNCAPNGQPAQSLSRRMSQPSTVGTKGTSNIFFKTRMCAKFLDGNCRNGETCTFAHGREDLREPPPNWQEIIREKDREAGMLNDYERIIHRNKICRKYSNGEECPYGEKCNFLHEKPSKFQSDSIRPLPRESSAISIGVMGQTAMEHRSEGDQPEFKKPVNANADAVQSSLKPWKIKICSKWEMTGQCPFGDRCKFAHGQSELKVPDGYVEADAMMPVHVKPLTLPPPTKADVGVPMQEAVKWKLHGKINSIYGDWPDDFISPEKVLSSIVG